MDRILYVTDLDGTLLGSDGRASTRSATSLDRMIAGGLPVTYATARSFRSARAATEGCGFRLPVIVYGGALVVDPSNGSILQSTLMEPDAVGAVLERVGAHGLPPLVFTLEGADDRISWARGRESSGIQTYLAERAGDPRLSPVESEDDLPTTSVFYISIIGDRAPIEALSREIRDVVGAQISVNVQSDTYHPEQIWLEVTHARANKAVAVRELAARLGGERIVSFGDNVIDLAMFDVSDESYAVHNAIPEVREAATGIIESNDRDGVVRWREEHAATE